MSDVAVLGIDLGKTSCSVAGLDAAGLVVLRRRVAREALEGLLRKLPPCTVAMEACCGAHHVSPARRRIERRRGAGHRAPFAMP